MKIAVCIKQVVTREWQLRINDSKTWIRDQDASFELNEPDAYALEEALRLKEKHTGEVVVVSAGPARAAQVIREALARGADRAIHIEADALATADAVSVADAIASAIRGEKFDLVLTGLQSDDHGFGQVGVIVAEKLGMPHATIIMEAGSASGLRVSASSKAGGSVDPADAGALTSRAISQLTRRSRESWREEEGDSEGRAAERPSLAAAFSVCTFQKSADTNDLRSPADAARDLVKRLRDEAR